jgi:hypothetical protein
MIAAPIELFQSLVDIPAARWTTLFTYPCCGYLPEIGSKGKEGNGKVDGVF